MAEMRERLRRPLQQELRRGCRDDVVVGGLETLAETVARPFAEVRRAIAGYAALAPEAREARVRMALEALAPPADGGGGAGAVSAGHAGTADAPPSLPGTATGLRGSVPAAAPTAASPPAGAAEAALGTSAREVAALLDAPLRERRVDLGAQAARKLGEIGLDQHRDVLLHFPRRYEDRRALPDFAGLAGRERATVAGTVTGRKAMRSRRGIAIVRAFLEDHRGQRLSAVWFNQPWLEAQLFPGQRVIVSGKPKVRGSRLELHVDTLEIDDDAESLSTGRIVGIYPATRGLSQAYLRRAVWRVLNALPKIPDHLPRSLVSRHGLIPLDDALRQAHFPRDEAELERALRRLRFDEFLFLELRVLLNRDPHLTGRSLAAQAGDLETFEASLPFRLTGAQRRALDEILADMARPRQMARLLQGDVGSGKTAVAAAAVWVAAQRGAQAALMAPTEILARQHFLNLREYLHPLGVRCELLTGAMSAGERRAARARIASGEAHLAVGTHALIQDEVAFHDLGLAVVDEEHRFGVEQRRKLLRGLPDVLVMSATPIPRSLALTYYGDLELSVIDALPPGRRAVTTRLLDGKRRREAYRHAWERIQEGRQAYVVAPLVEDSDAERMEAVVSATGMVEDLRALLPGACRVELLHGRMAGAEKDAVMARFRRGEIDLLVSTTVVEVGVDVPNATVMIIENAERFGLSQLHQLRGRVGRGSHDSTCILVAGDRSRTTQRRLKVIAEHGDGFLIAEKDLELRGPGELRGTRQSGLPELRLGDLSRDGDLIEEVRELAKRILASDPRLRASWAARLREELQRRSRAVGFREII